MRGAGVVVCAPSGEMMRRSTYGVGLNFILNVFGIM